MPSRSRVWAVVLSLVVVVGCAAVASESMTWPAKGPRCDGAHWVGAWAAAPSNAGYGRGDTAGSALAAQTVRMVVHPSAGGRRLRVRLSRRYAEAPARISRVTVAVRDAGAAVVPGTVRAVQFRGRRAVTLEPGKDVVSDPVRLRTRVGQDLLVSLHVPGVVDRPTEHALTNQTNYVSAGGTGDHTADQSDEAFTSQNRRGASPGWYFLSGVDVLAPRRTGAVVALGDSITDGFQASGPGPSGGSGALDRNVRYTDFLSDRIRSRRNGPALSVLNTGISGNRLLTDAAPPRPYGAAALRRFRADVLTVPGATDLIIMLGVNDLGTDEEVTAAEVTDALWILVSRAQMSGLTVHLGTLTPAHGSRQEEAQGSLATERRRQAVNRWIRTSGVADSVVDFDRALRDPADPSRLRPAYDSGDHLHPNTAGYEAMARAVSPTRLAGSGCP